MHKAGFVNIVGNPNVGKSTLMNQLVGERISIATFKAQTTRHRIMGIVNTPDTQIVFSDTPGVLKPNYKLQEMMLAFSESALVDADVLLYVTDVVENPEKNIEFLNKVGQLTIPVILLINKIDQSNQQQLSTIVERWHELLPNAEILPISAKNKFGVDMLLFKDGQGTGINPCVELNLRPTMGAITSVLGNTVVAPGTTGTFAIEHRSSNTAPWPQHQEAVIENGRLTSGTMQLTTPSPQALYRAILTID